MNIEETAFPPISDLVPHKRTMSFLDQVIYRDEKKIECLMKISSDDPFADEQGRVPSYIGIEYISQSVAAHGSLDKKNDDQFGKIGLLLGTRKLKIHVPYFEPQQKLLITSKLVMEQEGFGVFECEIRDFEEKTVLIDGRLSFYEPKNHQEIQSL